MINRIINYVLKNWENFTEKKPETLTFMQVSASHGKRFEKGKISILLFKDEERVPFLVAKFYRDKSYEHSLINEYKCLQDISSLGVAPQPKAQTVINEKLIIFEEFCKGKALDIQLQDIVNSCGQYCEKDLETQIKDHFEAAAKVISVLSTRQELVSSGQLKREISDVLRKYFSSFPCEPFEIDMLRGQAFYVLEYTNDMVMQRRVNFDFIPNNIILEHENNPRVIDWEFSSKSTMGFLEPLRFAHYYLLKLSDLGVIKSSNYCELLERVLSSQHWLSPILLSFLEKNLDFLNTVPELSAHERVHLIRSLFGIFFAFEAVLQHETIFFASPMIVENLKFFLGASNRFSKIKADLSFYERKIEEDKLVIEQLQSKLFYLNAMIKLLNKLHLKKPLQKLINIIPQKIKDWLKGKLDLIS